MSTELFPLSLPGVDVVVRRRAVFSTAVQVAQSGKELRAQLQSTPRYRYTVTFNYLMQDGLQGSDEAQALTDFFEARAGKFDTFAFDDPYDGVQRTVRFDMDELELSRIVDRVWEGKSIQLISVK